MRTLIPIADGCEEMEAVIVTDILRRAKWDVVLAGISGDDPVTASRGVVLIPDAQWDELVLMDFDLIVLPGGLEGTDALCKHDGVQETLRVFDVAEKWIAAICAAPLALHTAGVLEDRVFTCYPGIEKEMGRTDRSDDLVVIDQNIITSQGPGTAFDFALALIEKIDSAEAADAVRAGLLY
ncbi:MAG: DJ-1 family glyoxalase III [Kiritimatiellales bacterium]